MHTEGSLPSHFEREPRPIPPTQCEPDNNRWLHHRWDLHATEISVSTATAELGTGQIEVAYGYSTRGRLYYAIRRVGAPQDTSSQLAIWVSDLRVDDDSRGRGNADVMYAELRAEWRLPIPASDRLTVDGRGFARRLRQLEPTFHNARWDVEGNIRGTSGPDDELYDCEYLPASDPDAGAVVP
jgi:hypothetical protein